MLIRVPRGTRVSKKKTYEKSIKFAGATIRKRGSSWQVEFNHGGERKRMTLPTVEEAKGYAERMKVQLANQGVRAFDLNERQRVDAQEALELLEGRASLVQTAKSWLKANQVPEREISVAELLKEYVRSKHAQNRRPAMIDEIENKLGLYFRKGEITYPHELTRARWPRLGHRRW